MLHSFISVLVPLSSWYSTFCYLGFFFPDLLVILLFDLPISNSFPFDFPYLFPFSILSFCLPSKYQPTLLPICRSLAPDSIPPPTISRPTAPKTTTQRPNFFHDILQPSFSLLYNASASSTNTHMKQLSTPKGPLRYLFCTCFCQPRPYLQPKRGKRLAVPGPAKSSDLSFVSCFISCTVCIFIF